MIRFIPDTWLDAVLRPVAMAAPDGGVYVEIVAPDFRFVFALVLLVLLAVFALRHRRPDAPRTTTFALLAFCSLAFVPWLATSGNGRYFLALFFLVGPLCVGLLRMLPVTRALRFTLLGGMVALQLFLINENAPWGSWGLRPWRDAPAFAIDVPQDLRETPATYVTTTSISWSLIAPQFHPQSRWINLASQRGARAIDVQRTRRFLLDAKRLFLVFPSMIGTTQDSGMPAEQALALDGALAAFGLRLASVQACRVLPSRGLTGMGIRRGEPVSDAPADQRGFWACPLERVPADEQLRQPRPPSEMEAVFEKVERTCPRMFPPRSAATALLPGGGRRSYVDSDMRLYVMNDGHVWYKYMRALNGEDLGSVRDVMSDGFRMDCHRIRGRSGLPWEREI